MTNSNLTDSKSYQYCPSAHWCQATLLRHWASTANTDQQIFSLPIYDKHVCKTAVLCTAMALIWQLCTAAKLLYVPLASCKQGQSIANLFSTFQINLNLPLSLTFEKSQPFAQSQRG